MGYSLHSNSLHKQKFIFFNHYFKYCMYQHKQHFLMLYVQASRTQSMIALLLQNGWPATE